MSDERAPDDSWLFDALLFLLVLIGVLVHKRRSESEDDD